MGKSLESLREKLLTILTQESELSGHTNSLVPEGQGSPTFLMVKEALWIFPGSTSSKQMCRGSTTSFGLGIV